MDQSKKDALLLQLKIWAQEGLLTRDDVLGVFDSLPPPPSPVAAIRPGEGIAVSQAVESGRGEELLSHRIGIAEVLYVVGGLLVVLGIGILVARNWETFTTLTRLLVTLGSAVAAYGIGAAMNRNADFAKMGQIFFVISALLMPLGIGVALNESDVDITDWAAQSTISGIVLALYGGSYFLFRRDLFLLFSFLYGTWFYFSFASYLIGETPIFDTMKIYEYLVLLAGVGYLALGYAAEQSQRQAFASRLYALGVLAFLGAAFALGGWKPEQNILWELAFPFLSLGTIFASVYLRRTSFLSLGALYLMGYIVKITAEYFYESLGWELSLIIAGLTLIFVGYASFRLKKKYIG